MLCCAVLKLAHLYAVLLFYLAPVLAHVEVGGGVAQPVEVALQLVAHKGLATPWQTHLQQQQQQQRRGSSGGNDVGMCEGAEA
jgi:hypothetical protein